MSEEKKVISVEEFIQSIIDRIPTEFPNDVFTDDDIKKARATLEIINSLTRIEIHKYFRKAEMDLKSAKEFYTSIGEMSSAYDTTKDMLNSMDDYNPFVNEQKKKFKLSFNEDIKITPSLSNTENAYDDIDKCTIDQLSLEAARYESLAKLTLFVFKSMYQYTLETRGEMSITEITLEKLNKDRAFLEKSGNVNAAMKMKQYDKAIENVTNPSVKILLPKLANLKNIKSVINDYISNNITDDNLVKTSGLGGSIFTKFVEFFDEESKYENIYSLYETEINTSDVVRAARVFMYHVIHMSRKLARSGDITGVAFQLFVARVAEIQNFPHELRKRDNEECEMSKFRIEMFVVYMNLFSAYMHPDNIATLRKVKLPTEIKPKVK